MLGSKNRFGKWWVYLIVSLALVLVIAPFVWMVLGSFKGEGELRRVPPTWWPDSASLDNYTQLFARLDFGTYFANSAIVAIAVTAGNLLFCSMLGYALAMLNFPGKRVLLVLVLGTLMIPGVVTFVPLFVIVANAGLIDSLPGLILPFLVTPFGVFLMRQFISGLPPDLLDAGRVDGASELGIFGRIILPLCGPALATLGILTFLGSWNNFLWPLVVATDREDLHPARRPRPVLHGAEQHPVRAPARRRVRRRAAAADRLPRVPAALHRGHRHHRNQVRNSHDNHPLPRRTLVTGASAVPPQQPSRRWQRALQPASAIIVGCKLGLTPSRARRADLRPGRRPCGPAGRRGLDTMGSVGKGGKPSIEAPHPVGAVDLTESPVGAGFARFSLCLPRAT